jgi:hypothetical protein
MNRRIALARQGERNMKNDYQKIPPAFWATMSRDEWDYLHEHHVLPIEAERRLNRMLDIQAPPTGRVGIMVKWPPSTGRERRTAKNKKLRVGK